MVCLACGRLERRLLCGGCAADLRPAPDRRLASGLLVRPALAHRGAARVLVHRLKYQGIRQAGLPLVRAMAGRVPPTCRLLVPVPRVRLRTWRYGVDPALELTAALAAETGLPVARCLRPPWWGPARAGRPRTQRAAPRFTAPRPVARGALLVDDVLTTGATLGAAAAALGVPVEAMTATASQV